MSPKFLVEGMLDAALAGILHAHGSEYLRCQIARGIKALRLFLEMNALQLQGIDALNGLVVGLARHPAKRLMRAAVRQHYVVIIARNARDERQSTHRR